ncbi:YcnI family copper-binding membrane protein [Acidovorax sp. BL-A-41-H1]|uniref:YcnI family copper-binding membrane protein n=1 Tax=Acidovorax sp. BL-A-41-H1 TaxID=3421102 RepID=UPI003F799730
MSSNTIKTIATSAIFACATALSGHASAHVVLEYQVAPAGASYKATFKVGHGCGASPTRQVVVDIPDGFRGARPQPKPGWTLDVQRGKLATPYTSHGRNVTEDTTRITWTARTAEDALPSAHYDEFVLVGQTPEQAGMLYWPVRQICAQGRNDWTEVPQPGQKLHDLKSPAAALEVLPQAGGSAHQH